MAVEALRVLIVEDEALVALELESLLVDHGFFVTGVADRTDDALSQAAHIRPDLALVDLQLADGLTGPEVARRIVDQTGCIVVFMTANVTRIPQDIPGVVGVIPKPYTENGLRAALRFMRSYCRGEPIARPPSSIRLSRSMD